VNTHVELFYLPYLFISVTTDEGQIYSVHKSRLEDAHLLCRFKLLFLENLFYLHLVKCEPTLALQVRTSDLSLSYLGYIQKKFVASEASCRGQFTVP